MNGRVMIRRLIADSRGRSRLSRAVVAWIESGYRRWSAGEDPVHAFGFVSGREERSRRDHYLRRAAHQMPRRWSIAQRANRIREVEKRLWPFCGDHERPHALRHGWEHDVLTALEIAPLPSDRQLRKIVGSLESECQRTGVILVSEANDGSDHERPT